MEKLTQKWCIASFFEELKDGFEFDRSDNPLHITLAGVFALDLNGLEIVKIFEDLLKNTKSFSVTAGKDTYWGENKNIQVVLIQDSKELKSLQMNIYNKLISKGAIFNEPEYEGEGHTSHSTVQKVGKLSEGEIVTINKVSIVDMFPNNDGYRRKIVKTVKLA